MVFIKEKRKQVKSACVNCRKACKKCEEQRPCQRCVRLNMSDSCVDWQRKPREKGQKRGPYKLKKKLEEDGLQQQENLIQQKAEQQPLERLNESFLENPFYIEMNAPVLYKPAEVHSGSEEEFPCTHDQMPSYDSAPPPPLCPGSPTIREWEIQKTQASSSEAYLWLDALDLAFQLDDFITDFPRDF